MSGVLTGASTDLATDSDQMTTLGVTDVTCGSMFSCSDYEHPNTPNQEIDMDEVDDIGSDFDVDIAKEETVSHAENLKKVDYDTKDLEEMVYEDVSAHRVGKIICIHCNSSQQENDLE